MKKFVEELKNRLLERKSVYVEHNSWCGSTETGFYDSDNFDIEKLFKEIDDFAEEFKSKD